MSEEYGREVAVEVARELESPEQGGFATETDAAVAGTDDAARDAALDDAIDDLPRGDTEVREPLPVSGELPLLLSGRERFASIDPLPVTGDARVDAATARLEDVPDLPTSDHVEVYDDVHQRLQDALSDADAH